MLNFIIPAAVLAIITALKTCGHSARHLDNIVINNVDELRRAAPYNPSNNMPQITRSVPEILPPPAMHTSPPLPHLEAPQLQHIRPDNSMLASLLDDAATQRRNGTNSINQRLSPTQRNSLAALIEPPPVGGFAVLPSNHDEWRGIFGNRVMTRSDERIIEQSRHELSKLNIDTNISAVPRNINEFSDQVLHSKSAVFTIVGHNESGFLRIPPSFMLSIQEMSDSCARTGKICVILSCNSAGSGATIGPGVSITFNDATSISSDIFNLITIAVQSNRTRSDIVEAIPLLILRHERRIHLELTIRYVVPAASAGSGFGAFLLEDNISFNPETSRNRRN